MGRRRGRRTATPRGDQRLRLRGVAVVGRVRHCRRRRRDGSLAPAHRAELPNCLVVLLAIDLEMARARAAQRPRWLTAPEFEMLHQQAAELAGQADVTIGVDHLSIQEQVEAIERTWDHIATG